ncbi:hypothetical protein RKD37_001124 [Streptomyces ambofaciens]
MPPPRAVWAARRLARHHYATGGWSVGATALVSRWLARTLPAEERVVTVFPDGPQRYVGTVFNDAYAREHGLLGQIPADEPDEIDEPTARVVTRWTRCTRVLDPVAGARLEMAEAVQ